MPKYLKAFKIKVNFNNRILFTKNKRDRLLLSIYTQFKS